MLTSSGSRPKTYYTPQKRGAAALTTVEHNYDAAAFSPRPAGKSGFQMELVSRLSHEVRTATTTGDIQELRRAVSAGEYAPDPMAIAGRMMLLTED